MTSKLKSETARINGAKSRGPVTEEGKAKSSQNARKHGGYADRLLLDTESIEAFETIVTDYLIEYQPSGRSEIDIVQRMIEASWRRNQAETARTAAINLTMLEQAPSHAENFPEIDNPTRTGVAVLHLYGERLAALEKAIDTCHRQFGRALADLIKLRKFKADQAAQAEPPVPPPAPEPAPEPEPEPQPDPEPEPRNEPTAPPEAPQNPTPEPQKPVTLDSKFNEVLGRVGKRSITL